MKLNIIIPTRNPKLDKFNLLSIISQDIPVNKIIIINDSTNKKLDLYLKKIISKNLRKIILVDNKFLTKSNIPLKLGTPKWNLGVARNVGILISLSYSNLNTKTLFIDDDIFFKEISRKDFNKVLKENNLLGKIFIEGCPDLSRLEWIELYLKIKSPFKKVQNNYIEKIYQYLGRNSVYLIKKYTTLLSGTSDFISQIPQRNELSGGAFLCSKSVLETSFFSNWFDEDWLWFDKCRVLKKPKEVYSGIKVLHNSKRKKILVLDNLVSEEYGKILTNSLKSKKQKNILEIVKESIIYRKNTIKVILFSFKSLKDKDKFDRKIIKNLEKLLSWLEKIKVSKLISDIRDHKELNKKLLKNKEFYLRNIREVLNG